MSRPARCTERGDAPRLLKQLHGIDERLRNARQQGNAGNAPRQHQLQRACLGHFVVLHDQSLRA